MRARLARDESGFTMIELVVTVMLLGIILAPLSASVIVSIQATLQAEQRTTDSADQLLLASYFEHDVQSADDVLAGTTACGVTAVIAMHWSEVQAPYTADPPTVIERHSAYTATATGELQRVTCESAPHTLGTAAGATTTTGTLTLVNALSAAPTPTCDGGACETALPACAQTLPAATCLAVGVEDGVVTTGSTTVTSASAGLTLDYEGGPVTGAGIPPGTRIASVPNATTAVLTASATATSTATSLRFSPPWRPVEVKLPVTVVGTKEGVSHETYTFDLSATRRVTE